MATPVILQTFTPGATTANTATSVAVTPAANVTKGSTLVVGFGGGVNSVSTMTDSLGNTYTKATSDNNFSACEIWVATNKFDGPNVITATFTAEAATLMGFEVWGLDLTTPVDVVISAHGDGVTSNTPTATTAATTRPTDLVVAFTTFFSGAGTNLPTVGAGFTNFSSTNSTPTTGQNVSSGIETKLVNVKGTQVATFGLAFSTTSWEISVVTLKAANTPIINKGDRPHPFQPGLAR